MRVEKLQIYNFIKDTIVRGLIINRKVGQHIRSIEDGIPLLPRKGESLDNIPNYDNVQSNYNLRIMGSVVPGSSKKNSTKSL